MSTENKRYYWLQLPEDFFNDKTVKKLRKIPGGDTYTIIALKIMLKALKSENKLYYDGIEDSFAEEIALDIDEQTEAVEITVKYLIQSGWLFTESEDTLISVKGAELTGSETASARRVRKHRALKFEQSSTLLNEPVESKALHCNTDVTPMKRKCNGDIDIELDIELDKDIDNSLRSLSSTAPSCESAAKPSQTQKIFINFPLLGGKSVDITEEWCDEMQTLYGNTVNVRDEIKLALAWCNTNTKKKDWKKFLNNWFSNCLKRGGSAVPYEPKESEQEEKKEVKSRRLNILPGETEEEAEERLARVRAATAQIRAKWQKHEEDMQKKEQEEALRNKERGIKDEFID